MRTPMLLVACAVASCVPPPVMPDTHAAEALLGQAVQGGAREDPTAAHYLALAERELARARALGRLRDAEGARSWARRAGADADVARMLAIEAALRDAARRTEDEAEALFRRLERRR